MEIAVEIFIVAVGALLIWMVLMLEIYRAQRWKEVEQAPIYIICSSYGLGYEIQKKQLWPLPGGCAPMMTYSSLLDHYSSLDEAERQLAHYNQSKDQEPK